MATAASARTRILIYVILFAVVCHFIDVLGTYFAHSGAREQLDPIYLILKVKQPDVDWRAFIGSKILMIGSGAFFTWWGFRLTRRFYPAEKESISNFYVRTLYQKDISVAQSLYSLPKNYAPGVLLLGLMLLLISPYAAYGGYFEVARMYKWPVAPFFRVAGLPLDWVLLTIACLAFVMSVYVMWLDYLAGLRWASNPVETELQVQPQ